MKNLKLSLKKEIISNLEAKEVKGGGFGIATINTPGCESGALGCEHKTQQVSICNECLHTAERSCWFCE